MKQKIKSLILKLSPQFLNYLKTINNRRLFRRKFQHFQKEFKTAIYGENEIVVLSGPFKGMKYIHQIVWGSITPKWLGSYESELNEIICQIIDTHYNVIVDVGCAEGYYAVGLAYRMPKTKLYAFDTDFISRKQLLHLAKLNNVAHQITIGGYCKYNHIEEIKEDKVLLICDIEGFERVLLNPKELTKLKEIDILVELHDTGDKPETDSLMMDRFNSSHDITVIKSADRDKWVENFCNNNSSINVNEDILKKATNESRVNGQTWYWMRTNHTIRQATLSSKSF